MEELVKWDPISLANRKLVTSGADLNQSYDRTI